MAMETVSGVITLVQEDRFQLVDSSGRNLLFVLTYRAPVDGDDLRAFERSRCRVTVRCGKAEGLIANAAHDVTPG
jgi:hypothetical protein